MKQKILFKLFVAMLVFLLVTTPVFAQNKYDESDKYDKYVQDLITDAEFALQDLKSVGIETKKAESYFTKLLNASAEKDYGNAEKWHYFIVTSTKDSIASFEKIRIVEDLIFRGEARWLEMRNSKNMLILAKSAFDREDFTSAFDRISEAETIVNTELKAVSIEYILYYYWWAILFAFISLGITGRITYRKIKLKNLDKKISDRTTEEMNILSLMKETQEKHFKKREISASKFHKTMYDLQHRLAKLRREVADLRAERIKVFSIEHEIEYLEKEEKQVYDMIKKYQKDYFVRKVLSKNQYKLHIDELHERLAEIEESISYLQYLLHHGDIIRRISERRKPTSTGAFLASALQNIVLPSIPKKSSVSKKKRVVKNKKTIVQSIKRKFITDNRQLRTDNRIATGDQRLTTNEISRLHEIILAHEKIKLPNQALQNHLEKYGLSNYAEKYLIKNKNQK